MPITPTTQEYILKHRNNIKSFRMGGKGFIEGMLKDENPWNNNLYPDAKEAWDDGWQCIKEAKENPENVIDTHPLHPYEIGCNKPKSNRAVLGVDCSDARYLKDAPTGVVCVNYAHEVCPYAFYLNPKNQPIKTETEPIEKIPVDNAINDLEL